MKNYVVIVGGSSDVGRKLIPLLQKKQVDVLLVSRNTKDLSALQSQDGINTVQIETYDFEAVESAFLQGEKYFPDHQLLGSVCLTGSILLKPAHLTSEQELRECMEANIIPAFATLKSTVGRLQKQGKGGSIVLVSSVAAQVGLSNHEAIATAKSAINGMMRAAAATYARQDIRVNCVAPGLTDTKLASKITQNEAALKISTKMHPLGRIGRPEDIGAMIDFLLSPSANWITGQVLSCDGGLSSVRAL